MNLSKKNIVYGVISILILLLIFSTYKIFTISTERDLLAKNLLKTQNEFASTTAALNNDIALLQDTLGETLSAKEQKEIELIATLGERDQLEVDLKNEEAKIGILAEQVGSIAGVVGQIEKLTATDEELLQKYSRVYFLNEHYIPENLVLIDEDYEFDKEKRYWFHRDAYSNLKQMIIDARESGADLSVISSYRSFYSQGDLKQSYKVAYGEGANTFSADQGYSEHQLGTTVDFTESSIGAAFERFDETVSYSWLTVNAYKYGFILSYPIENGYYTFEPWHWRFIGVALATKLREDGTTFYDSEQRFLDKYLISIFDS